MTDRGGADPDHAVAMLLAAGRNAEAAELARKALVDRPDDPVLLIRLSAALSGLRRHEEAVATAERAIRAAPQFAPAYGALGDAHLMGTQRWHHAIDAYSRAIVLDHNESGFFTGRAQATLHYVPDGGGRRKRSRGAEALAAARADAERARQLEPDRALPHVVMAKVELAAKRAFEARAAAERALQLDPNSAVAHQVRGLALQQLGDIEGASAAYVASARENPHSDAPLHLLRNVKVSAPIGVIGAILVVRVIAGVAIAAGASGVVAGALAVLVLAGLAGWYWLRLRSTRRRMVPAARAALEHDRATRRRRWRPPRHPLG